MRYCRSVLAVSLASVLRLDYLTPGCRTVRRRTWPPRGGRRGRSQRTGRDHETTGDSGIAGRRGRAGRWCEPNPRRHRVLGRLGRPEVGHLWCPPGARSRRWRMRRGILLAPLGVVAAIALPAVALAASAVDVQANQPQVAGDPSSNATARFPTNKQNEQ